MPNDLQITRKKTRQISVGSVKIGGDAPITVQSMTTTDTRDVAATVAEIHRLEAAGCEIVRVTVPDHASAEALPKILTQIDIPLIADIHFNYQLALLALDAKVDGLRLNPGNIGSRERVERVVKQARDQGVSIRIGVNAGSLEKSLLEQYGYPTAEAMVASAAQHIEILESMDFYDTKVSLKASHVGLTVEAYRLFASRYDYPLHLGITEAGTAATGSIKSAVGLGILLAEGIGDTIRVSLAADPVEEVRVGYEILKSLHLRKRGVNVIACPTCGRLEFDVIKLSADIEKRLAHITEPIDVSILGCVVNGIGEGKEADIGIAGGHSGSILFRKGQIVRRVSSEGLESALIEEVEQLALERQEARKKQKSALKPPLSI